MQETFNRDLQEMHTIARRQEQSVSQCPNKAAMQAEFERLQAEQDYQQASDNTVEQVCAPRSALHTASD